jgi:5-methylcytosine-specific restriction endonuclease McrA
MSNNWNSTTADKVRETVRIKMSQKSFEEVGCGTKRQRVIEEQFGCCSKCGIKEWMGEPICLEIDHINGNNQDNSRDNLEALCPNCHSMTKTWRGRNRVTQRLSDEELLQHLLTAPTIRQGLLSAGMAAKGNNYIRAKKLLGV